MDKPYYMTWAKQSTAHGFELESVDTDNLYLKDGKKIYDLSSVSLQASFGLRHSLIIKRIKKQLDNFPLCSPKALFDLKDETTTRLLSYINRQGKIFYTVSGAESVENAAKIIRHLSGKEIIMARSRSYHGASLGALSLTGDWRNQEHKTVSEWTLRFPEPEDDPDLVKTRELILKTGPEKIAGIIIETITGANGVIIPPQSWYEGIQKLCDEMKLYLIMDEVVCGFGRTGTNFGIDHYPFLRPHIITMAKAISGGHIPFGAIWTAPEIAKAYDDKVFSFGLTNYGHPVGLASLAGVLDLVTSEKFIKNRDSLINTFEKKIKAIKKLPNVTATRQIGLLAAIVLKEPLSWDYFMSKGIYLIANGNTIVIAPHLTMSKKLLIESMDALIGALNG